jgi:acyl transferase domain-containing protein/thioesterase domain-containing protein/SAM-dependent methyltransferase/acyl carrier protein
MAMGDARCRGEHVAVIGMSGRFPGAPNVERFWENIRDGVESVTTFSEEELLASGVDRAVIHAPSYVRSKAIIEGVDQFDASFFGLSAREAEIMDPQHRLFLECAWEAIEGAGYDTERYDGSIGVFAGSESLNSYFLTNLFPNAELRESVGDYPLFLLNNAEFLCTRASYKLNLRGPSMTVQTACSTSLVAVGMALQSLLAGQCDMALAGGASISLPLRSGYLYREGMILSPDGHCRAFDADACGTVDGSGVGVVLLKRLDRALEDGDTIHAILRGAAINNDGSSKVGYMAPSVGGQAEVIAAAMAAADVEPEMVTYVEAHGTATRLGDPIEISALTQVYGPRARRESLCAIGSVKTNIGHLGAAAGIAGLIKTVQALKHRQIPTSLHFRTPSPLIGLENSPFCVSRALSAWETGGAPRIAGVSSFGIGGTNAHVIVEEAPQAEVPRSRSGEERERPHLLVLSARSREALEAATDNLRDHLAARPYLDRADVAYTLQTGRRAFKHRRVAICPGASAAGVDSARAALLDPADLVTGIAEEQRPIAFLFSGQGTPYVRMGAGLYRTEPVFREEIDRCAEILAPELGLDLRRVLYPTSDHADEAAQALSQTAVAQPALFAVELALARLWAAWGIHPDAMLGHSLGEYVAARLAGVFSLEDALSLVAARGRLMQHLPPGAMLAVPLAEPEVTPLLDDNLSLAAVNGASLCVVSGATSAIDALARKLAERDLRCTRLLTSHAFHSRMMEPALTPFAEAVSKVNLSPPSLRYISSVTGAWITDAEATSPSYWARHLRQTVRFADGLSQLLKMPGAALLEVGPGHTLATLARKHPARTSAHAVLSSLPAQGESRPDTEAVLRALGGLWIAGAPVDWPALHARAPRRRVPLPTYPFERQRYWIDEPKRPAAAHADPSPAGAPPPFTAIAEAGRTQAKLGLAEVDRSAIEAKQRALDDLCLAYMNRAIQRLGAFRDRERALTPDEVLDEARVLPSYRQLVRGWLDTLADRGHLRRAEGKLSSLCSLSESAALSLLSDARRAWSDAPLFLEGVRRTGERVGEVLIGETSPHELSFDGASFSGEESAVEQMAIATYCNAILESLVRRVVSSLPPGAHLKVLEIGAGMGLTTSRVLPILPPSRTSYTFTDVGRLFLRTAEEKFRAYPFVKYALLDIERPPVDQGFELESFDIVLASNVLHVARRMDDTIRYVRSLLAPGGLLLLWEITEHQLEFDLTAGFLMNAIEDGPRTQGNPFLSRDLWLDLLRAHDFIEAEAIPEAPMMGHQIFLSRASLSGSPGRAAAFTARARDALYTEPSSAPQAHARPELKSAYVPPGDELERTIASIWGDLLGVDQIGIHDDYFELGGDSLLSVRLVSRLTEATKVKLSTRHVLDVRTIAGLARLIRAESAPRAPDQAKPATLVTIQAGGARRPLFCVHPVGGNVLCYAALAPLLGADQPVYGLQARGLDGAEPPRARIEEMAADYIEVIKAAQPTGPYLLAGFSFGGIVAFEIAQQLARMDDTIALLALIDAGPPVHGFKVSEMADAMVLAWFAAEVGLWPEDQLPDLYASLQQTPPDEQMDFITKRAPNEATVDIDVARPLLSVFKMNLLALRSYVPQPFAHRAVLYRCDEPRAILGSRGLLSEVIDPLDESLGWNKLSAAPIEVHALPGDHHTLLTEPYVVALGALLKARLASV